MTHLQRREAWHTATAAPCALMCLHLRRHGSLP
jgi:hypothetical protein